MERASGMGGSHLEDNCVVNPWGWPLALPSALCLSWLLSRCLHPSACLKEELLEFIATLTHQLETCQAAYSFTTIFWALTPEVLRDRIHGRLLVRGSMLHNYFLMHLIHSACMCTDALSLAYWMHLASVKQGKKHPLLLFISVLDVPVCLWNKSWNSKHGAQDTTKIKIYYTTSAISFSQWWYTPGEHQTCV